MARRRAQLDRSSNMRHATLRRVLLVALLAPATTQVGDPRVVDKCAALKKDPCKAAAPACQWKKVLQECVTPPAPPATCAAKNKPMCKAAPSCEYKKALRACVDKAPPTDTEPTCAKPRVAAIAPTPPARSSTANFHQEELASGMKLA